MAQDLLDSRPSGAVEQPRRWGQSLASAALAAALILVPISTPVGIKVALVVLASVCALDLVRREARDPGSPVPIAWSTAALFTVAVICGPRFSHDLWSYAIVGRIVTAHHSNPYLHSAAAFSHDPLFSLVGLEWRHGTTPYGPLFTLYGASVAFVGGAHPLLYRLAFEGGAAIALALALVAVWRTTRSTSALALLGLHPVIACLVVNGGHNDAFVGVGVLLTVISARRERYATAGWWITAAVLVKATAGLALVPLLAWAWTRGGRSAVRQILTGPVVVALPIMLLTPGMLHSLGRAKTTAISRSSIWNLPLRLLPSIFEHQSARVTHLVTLALAVVLILVVCAALMARRLHDPVPGVVAAMAAWLIFSAYILAPYTVWALPTAALLPRSRLTRLIAIQGVVIAAVFMIPRTSLPGHTLLSNLVQLVIPVAMAALLVWTVAPAIALAKSRRTSSTPRG